MNSCRFNRNIGKFARPTYNNAIFPFLHQPPANLTEDIALPIPFCIPEYTPTKATRGKSTAVVDRRRTNLHKGVFVTYDSLSSSFVQPFGGKTEKLFALPYVIRVKNTKLTEF